MVSDVRKLWNVVVGATYATSNILHGMEAMSIMSSRYKYSVVIVLALSIPKQLKYVAHTAINTLSFTPRHFLFGLCGD